MNGVLRFSFTAAPYCPFIGATDGHKPRYWEFGSFIGGIWIPLGFFSKLFIGYELCIQLSFVCRTR